MRRNVLFASVLAVQPCPAFANTNAGGKLYVCATAKQVNLTQSEFAALTWVEIGGLGMLGETGKSQNILTYDTWNTTVTQKAKGITNAGDPDIEVARDTADPGQDILRTAAGTNLNYAFKLERNDKPDADPESTGTIIYNRGLVVGPKRPNGRNEDFDLEVFTLGLNQVEIVVDPTSGL